MVALHLLLLLLPVMLGVAAAEAGCQAASCAQRFWGSDARCPPGQCSAADWEVGPQTAQHISGAPAPASSPALLLGDDVVFVGRVQKAADGTTMFDMNGVQIKTTVTGTTGLAASLSQVHNVTGNVFQVYLDGVLQPKSRFNTSAWLGGKIVNVPLFPAGSLDVAASHAVTIFKDTEPCFAGTQFTPLVPNYITFHGFSGDDSSARLLPVLESSTPQHKVEFLGDSITAGFDNLCDIPGSPTFPMSESFAKSWATLICNELSAECHYNAWSGLGMVRNCCGGSTLGSDVWTRTLATVGSTNASDQHGTTAANEWDFSSWQADAVVINLGTNDHLGPPSPPGPAPSPPAGCFMYAKGQVTYKYAPGNVFPTDAKHQHGLRLVDNPAQCCALCRSLKNCSFFTYSGGGTLAKPTCYTTVGKGCCFLKTAEGGDGASDCSTCTSGSTKPLPPPPPTLAQKYQVRYLSLVTAAAKVYGKNTGFFLACGPMSIDYCPEVEWVISQATTLGIKAYLLNQSNFEDGAYGKKCAYGHPGSQDDAAMAKSGSAFIQTTMGW